jgi:hypothetical protein
VGKGVKIDATDGCVASDGHSLPEYVKRAVGRERLSSADRLTGIRARRPSAKRDGRVPEARRGTRTTE